MIPRATENTVSSLLRDGLQELGVRVELFPRITTPAGSREPDLLCVNAGTYPVEAKFTERDLVQAIAKVQNDYLKHHRVLGIKGGFAILYPEDLAQPMPVEAVENLAGKLSFKLIAMFPPEDPRPFAVYEGRLQDVARILSEHILAPPKRVEPSIEYIMKSLRESVLYILNGLRHLKGYELEVFFGGKDVFKNILQYEEGKYPVEELRSAAAYLLLNQILFYQVLSRTRRGEFEEIDTDRIKRPKDLNDYFHRVLNVNYKTVYSYDVASLIPQEFVDQVKTMVNLVQGLSPEKVGGDLLGTIFHDLVPFETRKNVAAFYTNVLAAELLATLAIESSDAKVADLAVGSGGLLVAAYRRKRELLGRPMTQEDHRRFVEEDLLGIDVMPFAANVAACHLALQSPEYFTNKVNVAVWDSTCLRPGMRIPSVTEAAKSYLTTFMFPKTTERGAVSLTDKEAREIELGKYDVIIMNPPFTRQERLPEDYKDVLFQRLSEYRDYLHGQLGLYGFFILLADRFLKEDGRIALVLPATVLKVVSCEGIRRMLTKHYNMDYVITTWQRAAFSEAAQFREILLVARKRSNKTVQEQPCLVVTLKRIPKTSEESLRMADQIRQMASHPPREVMEDETLLAFQVSQSELREKARNLFPLIAFKNKWLTDFWEELIQRAGGNLVSFRGLLDRLDANGVEGVESRRGGKVQNLTISQVGRAIKKSDVWVISKVQERIIVAENRFTGERLSIPLRALQPALRRVALVNTIDISNKLDYVVIADFPDVKRFLSAGVEKMKIYPGFWNRWRAYVEDRMSRLALVRRADVSASGTCLLAFYSRIPFAPPGVAWSINVKENEAKLLSLWFNSTINLLQALLIRKETRGAFLQLDEYVLEEALVPDFERIDRRKIDSLLAIFDKVKKMEFPSILEQLEKGFRPRYEIDKALLTTLGFDKQEAETILPKLYTALAEEIRILKQIMAGETEEEEE
ncbi:MAG: Eco57I restriction-modification methylase domain-containing protein [Thermoproteota archaeon]